MPSRSSVVFDPLAILTRLSDVEHLVVGGFAAVLYGAPTVTSDLDVIPRASEENIGRLAGVLRDLRAIVREPRSAGRRIEVTVEGLDRSKLESLGVPLERVQSQEGRLLVHVREDASQQLIAQVLAAQGRVTRMQPAHFSLEQLFLDAVREAGRAHSVGGEINA